MEECNITVCQIVWAASARRLELSFTLVAVFKLVDVILYKPSCSVEVHPIILCRPLFVRLDGDKLFVTVSAVILSVSFKLKFKPNPQPV